MPSEDKREKTRVIQVSNVTTTATREQLYQLFSFLGRIDEIKVYPSETNPLYATMQQKLAYVKFDDSSAVESAQHITNTVFIDRALICVPVPDGRIPDEDTALKTGGPSWPGQRQLPPNVINQLQHSGDQHVVVTIDPSLSALGLPAYPSLPANTDASKIEEIRRTIYVGNVPKSAPPEEILDFFNNNIGEVMYLRMAGSENLPSAYAYIEFSNQHTVPTALQNNGMGFQGQHLRIQHSRVAIIKPTAKTQDMAKREIEEAMRKQAGVTGMPGSTTTRTLNLGLQAEAGWSRSRSPSQTTRRRSRTRSPRRRSRSRERRRRSRSRERRRKSREKRREAEKKERERKEREREKRRRSRSRSKEKDRKRDKDRDRDKDKRRDERRRDEKREKDKDRDKSKDKSSSSRSSDKEKTSSKPIKSEPKSSLPLTASEEDEMALRERLLEKVLLEPKTEGDSLSSDNSPNRVSPTQTKVKKEVDSDDSDSETKRKKRKTSEDSDSD